MQEAIYKPCSGCFNEPRSMRESPAQEAMTCRDRDAAAFRSRAAQYRIARYVAANGDVLLATLTGPGTQNLVTGEAVFSGSETYTGGTGRFAVATGASTFAGSTPAITNVGFFATTGKISY